MRPYDPVAYTHALVPNLCSDSVSFHFNSANLGDVKSLRNCSDKVSPLPFEDICKDLCLFNGVVNGVVGVLAG